MPAPKKYTNEQIDHWISLVKGGQTAKYVAIKYNVPVGTLWSLFTRRGFSIRDQANWSPSNRLYTDEQIEAWKFAITSGSPAKQVAKAFEVDYHTLVKVLNRNGFRIRPPKKARLFTTVLQEDFNALEAISHRTGKTMSEVTSRAIHYALERGYGCEV